MNRTYQNRYRTIFISDLHLGSAGSKVDRVQRFLWSTECENLYLVGDLIDGWVGSRPTRWTQDSNNIIRTILGKSKQGTNVFYTPGNHDAFMRRMNGQEFGNILIDHSFIHTTASGQDLLVVHGDLFDPSCTKFLPVAFVGAWIYEWMTLLNVRVNKGLSKRDMKNVDFASKVKLAVKTMLKKKNNFESALIEEAQANHCQGVVCGHVHRPANWIDKSGIAYLNCGDWVENCTALVEDYEGGIHLIRWHDVDPFMIEITDSTMLGEPDGPN